MLNTDEDVYRELTHKIGKAPRRDIWQKLVDESYVEDTIVTGELSVVTDRYRELNNRPHLQKSKEKDVHKEPPDIRLKYLSEILAYDAAKEPPVIDFRRDVLHDQLLSPDEVKNWIDGIASKERGDNAPVMNTDERIKLLSYAVQGDNWTYHVPEAGNVMLKKLRMLSGYLARRYTWQEPQATTFVLTGLIPLLPLAQTTIHYQSLHPTLNTVTIKLNPRLSPDEVAGIYTRARHHLMAKGQKRNRPMTKKHLELGVFYHTHQGMKGREMMNIWNKEHPGDTYSQVANFDRDIKHAHNRLVGWVNKGV